MKNLTNTQEERLVKEIARTTFRDVATKSGLSRGKLYDMVNSHRKLYNGLRHNIPRGREGGPLRVMTAQKRSYGELRGLNIQQTKGHVEMGATFQEKGRNRTWHITDPKLFQKLSETLAEKARQAPKKKQNVCVEQNKGNWQVTDTRTGRKKTKPQHAAPHHTQHPRLEIKQHAHRKPQRSLQLPGRPRGGIHRLLTEK